MTEREALIAIRDKASTLTEAIEFARQGLRRDGERPLDLEEPVPSTEPGYRGDEPDA